MLVTDKIKTCDPLMSTGSVEKRKQKGNFNNFSKYVTKVKRSCLLSHPIPISLSYVLKHLWHLYTYNSFLTMWI